jgi:hypothetical protein
VHHGIGPGLPVQYPAHSLSDCLPAVGSRLRLINGQSPCNRTCPGPAMLGSAEPGGGEYIATRFRVAHTSGSSDVPRKWPGPLGGAVEWARAEAGIRRFVCGGWNRSLCRRSSVAAVATRLPKRCAGVANVGIISVDEGVNGWVASSGSAAVPCEHYCRNFETVYRRCFYFWQHPRTEELGGLE